VTDKPSISIIVPFHENLAHLQECLVALTDRPVSSELTVVADGPVQDCRDLAHTYGARVLDIAGPSGPAVGRNRGSAIASGDVLVFVDADVVVAPGVLARIVEAFENQPDAAAVFGAYDETPSQTNFISQYKNLAHAYIHQSSESSAKSFWTGLGAVRASVFAAVGGFDERFRRPCVEDIDLGYRMTAAGHRIVLDSQLRCSHLKRWTLRSLITTDVRDRAVPWTQLMLRSGMLQNDLNLRIAYRASAVLSWVLLLLIPLVLVEPFFLAPLVITAGSLYSLNHGFYEFFARRRGVLFAVRVGPLHFLYYLYSSLAFLVGNAVYFSQRLFGIRLPGAIPVKPWPRARLAPSLAMRTQPNGACEQSSGSTKGRA
jgi:GT2 family glycosyltransferase